jgi:UDP:flavonoid glycosyltransferase YjiC (YdhE family)
MYPPAHVHKVVISPLDWGLGHATRIIPIIRYLVKSGRHVTVAATSTSIQLIRIEFPDLEYLTITGYQMDYPRNGRHFLLHMLRRLPRILKAILKEYLWLQDAQRIHQWDMVISDNRYGFRHPAVPSILITHQINIRTEISPLAEKVVKTMIGRLIGKFSACWIPDEQHSPGLAGSLSHGAIPRHAKYIGPLSRLKPQITSKRDGLLIMLSGPEPQRTLLETRILEALLSYEGPVTLVRGLPYSSELPASGEHHRMLNHLPADALADALAAASLVICRSGYSSVMDLVATNTPAVLIPTPGQTEQEYLARHLEKNGYFPYLSQETFTLDAAFRLAKYFNFRSDKPDFHTHLHVLEEFLPALSFPS